jgi:hypothetical protein
MTMTIMIPETKISTNTNTTGDNSMVILDNKTSSHNAYVTNEELLVLAYFMLGLSKNTNFQIIDDKMSDFIEDCKNGQPYYNIDVKADDIEKIREFKKLAEKLLLALQENRVSSQNAKTIEFAEKLLNRRRSENVSNNEEIPDDDKEAKPMCYKSRVTPRHYITGEHNKRNTVPWLNFSDINKEQPKTSFSSIFTSLLCCCNIAR